MGMMMLALVALFALSKSKKAKAPADVTPALPDMPDETEEPAPVVRTPGSSAAEVTETPDETVEEVVVTPPSGVEDEPEEDVSPALPDQETGPVEVDIPKVPVQDPLGGGVTVEEVQPEGEAVDVPSPHEQAIELARYVAAELKAGRGGNLGVRGKPSAFVQAAQLGMGMSQADADGIYGPATRAAGQALGVVMPARR
jgi:hypothetical protein